MAIRWADSDDLTEIVALERSCEGAPHWSEVVWGSVLGGSAGASARRMTLVAVMSDRIVGLIVAGVVAESAELESVAVAERQRGRGIAKALCRSAMVWAREQGAQRMELEVRSSNAAALRLYRSLGFEEQGRRLRYYRDPEEDAVLMEAVWRRSG